MGELRVFFMSLDRLQAIRPSDHWALISIRDPMQQVQLNPAWKHLLTVEFKDSAYSLDDLHVSGRNKFNECIRPAQAKEITLFVDLCIKKQSVNTIICQSNNYRRAAAVARHIADLTNARLCQDTTYCNSFVYNMLTAPEKYQRALSEIGGPSYYQEAERKPLGS